MSWCWSKLTSQVDYCASKFACVGLDEALRVELAVQVSFAFTLKWVAICHQVLDWEAVIRYRVELAEQVAGVWGVLGGVLRIRFAFIILHGTCHVTQKPAFNIKWQSKFYSQGNSKFIKTTAVCPYYISTGMFSGVASKIIPILDPEFVASSVVDATLSNKEIILLPWWSTYLFMLKVISIISFVA